MGGVLFLFLICFVSLFMIIYIHIYHINICIYINIYICIYGGGMNGKKLASQHMRLRDVGSIPGLGRSPGGGHSNPFQYSCLENSMDRGAWWARVHRVAKSRT